MKRICENRVGEIRKNRGIGASDLARRVNVSRQTIHAIECGTYVPNTTVTLQLARELEVSVEELFALVEGTSKSPESVSAEVLSPSATSEGQPVRICRVGPHWVSVPVSATPCYMPEADGIIKQRGRIDGRADLVVLAKEEAAQKRLVLAGCDPAASLLSTMVERISGVEVIAATASSKLALTWLKEGKVHIAGSHLEDPKSGEFNVPHIRETFPGEEMLVVTFARWEEGLVVSRENPKKIRSVDHLTRRGIRFMNREPGSGCRTLMDKLLAQAGIPSETITGYDRVAFGHLAAAHHVVSGDADACLATRSAAQTFGLDFIPLHSARYDLALRKKTADLPTARAFLDVLQRATLRRKLEVLAGYDTSQTGKVVS
jgi:molybdate-binding protein/DNA-binding XRE family transcriptional regulator